MSQYQIYVAAKAAIRRDPTRSDEEIAAAIGVPDRIIRLGGGPGTELDTIAAARADSTADAADEYADRLLRS